MSEFDRNHYVPNCLLKNFAIKQKMENMFFLS